MAKPDIAAAVAKRTARNLEKANVTTDMVLEPIRRQVVGEVRALFTPEGKLGPSSNSAKKTRA